MIITRKKNKKIILNATVRAFDRLIVQPSIHIHLYTEIYRFFNVILARPLVGV